MWHFLYMAPFWGHFPPQGSMGVFSGAVLLRSSINIPSHQHISAVSRTPDATPQHGKSKHVSGKRKAKKSLDADIESQVRPKARKPHLTDDERENAMLRYSYWRGVQDGLGLVEPSGYKSKDAQLRAQLSLHDLATKGRLA